MKILREREPGENSCSFIPCSLIPKWIFYALIFVSLALPNLIYSGVSWFDTLHIMKWAWTMVPVALISIIGGLALAVDGPKRSNFRLGLFGCVWFALIVFISAQPLWANIFSHSTYAKEWFFFATLFAAYVFCANLFTDEMALRCVLWLANINAAINVVFAEILIRCTAAPYSFIMNVPGNYIGNTGQQEMFGLWMAIAAMNGIFLHMLYSHDTNGGVRSDIAKYANLFLLAFNSWGLWNSTTRAGMLSLMTGTAVLAIIVWNCKPHRLLKDIGFASLIVALMLVLNICMGAFGLSRAYDLIYKTSDMLMNPANFGMRREIWLSSWNVVKKHPIAGVGLGHFKWHYLEGQRDAFKDHPDMQWQFTYWAHSEYLQWFAEFGLFGAFILLCAAVWWIWSFVRALNMKRDLSYSSMWGCAFVFLIWFDAIFSRPFHRIENVIWLSLAFALANRAILPTPPAAEKMRAAALRLLGAFMAAASVVGLVFFFSGCMADKDLRAATLTNNVAVQRAFIDRARSSLMKRDEANEQLAYNMLAIAEITKRPEDLNAAIYQLYTSFHTRPQGKQLVELLDLAQRIGNRELLAELVTYLHPSSYTRTPSGDFAPRTN